MARGRRGRRSRSKQRSKGAGTRSSKAKSSKKKSSNRRGSGKAASRSKAASRRSAPKKSAPKKKAPTKRRTPTNKRGSGVSPKKKEAAKTVKKVVAKVTKPQAAAAATKKDAPKTTPKKTTPTPSAQKTMREKAAERHAQFKKTGVQTYGGTRNVNSYSKSELDKLQSYARTTGQSFGMTIGQPNVQYPGKTGMNKLSADQVPNADGLVMNSVGQYVTPEQLAKDDADAGPSIGRSIAKGINTIKNNVVPFGRRIPDLKTDYTVAQEARLKATTPYKTGQRTKTGAIAGRGSSDNRMQIQQPTAPTRESVEQLAAMSDSLPPDSIRDTPAPETTTPTPNAVVQQERFIDVGGGKQVSANNMADYLASLRGTWDQQSQQYQSQIGQLQGQVGDYQGQIGGLQTDIGGYRTAGERQQQLLDQYQMQIGGLQSDISGYRGRVSEYEKSLGDYRTQVGGLRRDIGDYRTQIGGLQSDIGGYKGQIGELQGDIKGYQGEISGLRGDVLGLRGDISNYQARERKAQEMQIRDAQRQRVAQSYGLGKKKPKVGGVKTGRIEEEARMYGPRATFNRSGLRISSLNI